MNNRQYLVSVFEDSMAKIENDRFLSDSVRQSVQSQQFIAHERIVPLPSPRFDRNAPVLTSRDRTFEAALRYKTAYPEARVAVLNFASATIPGGGVVAGASAQEECLCRVSTLYPCLKDKRMWYLFYSPHRISQNPLHNDDIIYTKNVQVFKDDDYRDLARPVPVDVITCAAPNLMEDTSLLSQELYVLHTQRWGKILSVAAANEADVLILGAFGCGAFRNDPYVVAQAFKSVAPEYLYSFKTIEFAVYCRETDIQNYTAFSDVLSQL